MKCQSCSGVPVGGELAEVVERRRARLGPVDLEEREEEAAPLALLLDPQLLDERPDRKAGEEREDARQRLLVPRVLAEAPDALEVYGVLGLPARRVPSESGLTLFSTTSFSATSNIRDARVSEPWLSCSTAATTISWKRFPTSSWSSGRVTTRRMACVADARADESASSTGSDGSESGHGGIERPRVRMTSPDGTSTPAARSRSSAAPSSPSDRAAIAATARICATRASRGDWTSAP